MHIKELYKKYLEGTLSEDELLSFKNSISNFTDDGVWELISNEESVDMHFIGMSEDQKKDIFKTIDIKIKRRQKKAMVFKYVAGVACFLFLLIGFYFYSIPTERESYMTEVVSPIGKRMEVVMADGSKIFMNEKHHIIRPIFLDEHDYQLLDEVENFENFNENNIDNPSSYLSHSI